MEQLQETINQKDEEIRRSKALVEQFQIEIQTLQTSESNLVGQLGERQKQFDEMAGKLAEESVCLDDWKRYAALKENELSAAKIEFESNQKQLHETINQKDEEIRRSKALVEQFQIEIQTLQTSESYLVGQLGERQKQLDEMAGKLAENSVCLDDWNRYAALKENELSAAKMKIESNQKLQDEMTVLKMKSAGIAAELQKQLESLDRDLAAADAVNSDLMERNSQLEQQVNSIAAAHEVCFCFFNLSGSASVST